jgi:hypothetical protein
VYTCGGGIPINTCVHIWRQMRHGFSFFLSGRRFREGRRLWMCLHLRRQIRGRKLHAQALRPGPLVGCIFFLDFLLFFTRRKFEDNKLHPALPGLLTITIYFFPHKFVFSVCSIEMCVCVCVCVWDVSVCSRVCAFVCENVKIEILMN